MAVTPRSLILDLLATMKGGAMPVRALVEAGAIFGLEGNSMRVALARLLAAGVVERDERGRYRPGSDAAALTRRIAGWRGLEERLRPWGGTWVAVHRAGVPRAPRGGGSASARALRLLGFRTLAPGLEVRPDNLVGGVATLRHELRALGLDPSALVFALDALEEEASAHARALWDTAALHAEYRTARRALERSERRLPTLPRAHAMAESFELGGRVIRQLVLDPLLPAPLVDATARQALVAAMRRYDRAGRSCWAAFLRDHGVLHDRAPADVRVADARGALAALAEGAVP